jgi:hypothetical protein
MSSLIHGSYFIQEAMHVCLGFVFVGLAVAANTAQSEESSFTSKPDISKIQLPSSEADWLPSYRLATNIVFSRLENPVPTQLGFNSTPRLFLVPETKKEDDWSINIQKQIPYSSNCSPLSSLLCFDSKEERPDIKPLRDSLWIVWRKVFPF